VKIGIFGGTFDPPHIGHLIAAQDALQSLQLDKVLFIPALVPPHKQQRAISPPVVRLRMTEAAASGDARFEVSDVELKRAAPSYTVDTLRHLGNGGDELFLLLGVDQIRDFATWREPQQVRRLARLVMMARGGIAEPPESGIVQHTVPVTRIDISSTLIRQRVAAGQSIRYLVPAAVEEIIAAEGLYSGSLG
jgi:nicotinate-nucleotide adenylyltransferase